MGSKHKNCMSIKLKTPNIIHHIPASPFFLIFGKNIKTTTITSSPTLYVIQNCWKTSFGKGDRKDLDLTSGNSCMCRSRGAGPDTVSKKI